MMRFAAVALVVVGLAFPACAQRGGGGHGGGGFAGHSAGAFHGGFAAPRSSGGMAGRSYGNTRYPARSFRANPNSNFRSGFRAPYSRVPYNQRYASGGERYRRPYSSGHRAPFFFYPIPDWIGLGPLGCDPDAMIYDDDSDECMQQPDDSDQPMIYGGDQGDQGEPLPPPPDQPQYAPPAYRLPAQPRSTPLPTNEIATTIVFKDGRPPEQIHNYALTQTTLFVLDQQHRDIPLDQVDLAATEKTNRDVGVEFQVPQTVQ